MEQFLQRDNRERQPLGWQQRQELIPRFEADLELLERVLGSDFSDWRTPRDRSGGMVGARPEGQSQAKNGRPSSRAETGLPAHRATAHRSPARTARRSPARTARRSPARTARRSPGRRRRRVGDRRGGTSGRRRQLTSPHGLANPTTAARCAGRGRRPAASSRSKGACGHPVVTAGPGTEGRRRDTATRRAARCPRRPAPWVRCR